MARKRVIEPPSIKSWEDANEALRQIAEATIALADIEGEMNKQILGAKKAAEEQSKPFKDRSWNGSSRTSSRRTAPTWGRRSRRPSPSGR